MGILLLAILIGLIPAVVARNKGYSFALWWIYGAAIFIVALPHALLMRPNARGIEYQASAAGNRKCPYCAEIIKAEAVVCRYCGRDVPAYQAPPIAMSEKQAKFLSTEFNVGRVLAYILVGAAIMLLLFWAIRAANP